MSTLLGIVLTISPISEMQAHFFAAIVNGTISPIILVFVMLAARDRNLLGDFTAGPVALVLGWLTTALMGGAALALLVTLR